MSDAALETARSANGSSPKAEKASEGTDVALTRVSTLEAGSETAHNHGFTFWSAVGLAFAILNSWTAMAGSLNLALPSGGPTSVIWGIVVSGIGNLCLALSLAEICHVYPTAGGQYHWAYALSPPNWAPLISWYNGWFAVAGWWALAASGGSLAGQFITGIIYLLHEDTYTIQRWHIFLVYLAFTFGAAFLNIFSVRLLPIIDRAALFWSLAGVTIISITVLSTASPDFQTAKFVFGKYLNTTGWNNGVAWLLGLLQSAFGLTAYDAVSHMVEEMPNAAVNAPKAMVLSVIIGSVSSFIFFIILLFCLTDVDLVISSQAGALLEVLYQATSSKAGAVCLLIFPVVCMAFTTTALFTTASRMTQAFARDGGLPLSRIFARQNRKLDVPVNAILLTTVLVIIFGCIYLGSSAALNAILSSSIIGLNVSYSTPVALLLFRGRQCLEAEGRKRTIDLGNFWGPVANVVGLAFALLTTVFFLLPPFLPVEPISMNYACVVVGLVLIVSTLTWITNGRRHFHGPRDFEHQIQRVRARDDVPEIFDSTR